MARELAPCGTPGAYLRHWHRGEAIDEACRLAHNAANNAKKRAARAGAGTPCTSCPGVRKPYSGRASDGWCQNCTDRWIRAGRPAAGPPPPCEDPGAIGRAARAAQSAARREEYGYLRDVVGLTPEQAAADLGIAPTTMRRYERARREAVGV